MSRIGRWAVLAVLTVACLGCEESVSDTGYVGTWERINSPVPSTISLRPEGDGYVMRWSLEDGPRRVRCDRDGVCEEWFERNKTYRYEFRVFHDDARDSLMIERVGTPILDGLTPLTMLDRVELQEGNLELWTYVVAVNGEPLEKESAPYRFRKISDEPY